MALRVPRRPPDSATTAPKEANNSPSSSTSRKSTKYGCRHAEPHQRIKNKGNKSSVPARGVRTQQRRADSSGGPRGVHKNAGAAEGVGGGGTSGLYEPAAAAAERKGAGGAGPARLGSRFGWQDHAAGLQEDARGPTPTHLQRHHLLPQHALQVLLPPSRLLFVNTPMLFDTIWNQIAHAIPKDTQENIIMIADEIENIYEFA